MNRTICIALALVAFAAQAHADKSDRVSSNEFVLPAQLSSYTNMSMPCGRNGTIIIDTSTGNVKMKDCGSMNAASRAFWKALFYSYHAAAPTMAYHLLTQTQGGTMQLVKGLTKHECEFMLHRVLGEPATPDEMLLDRFQKKINDATRVISRRQEVRVCSDVPDGTVIHDADPDYGGEFSCKNHKLLWSTVGDIGVISNANPSDIKTAECFQ